MLMKLRSIKGKRHINPTFHIFEVRNLNLPPVTKLPHFSLSQVTSRGQFVYQMMKFVGILHEQRYQT